MAVAAALSGAGRSRLQLAQGQGGFDAGLLLFAEELLAQLLQTGPVALLRARLVVLRQPLLPVLFFPVEPGHVVRGGFAVAGAACGVAGAFVGVLGVERGGLGRSVDVDGASARSVRRSWGSSFSASRSAWARCSAVRPGLCAISRRARV